MIFLKENGNYTTNNQIFQLSFIKDKNASKSEPPKPKRSLLAKRKPLEPLHTNTISSTGSPKRKGSDSVYKEESVPPGKQKKKSTTSSRANRSRPNKNFGTIFGIFFTSLLLKTYSHLYTLCIKKNRTKINRQNINRKNRHSTHYEQVVVVTLFICEKFWLDKIRLFRKYHWLADDKRRLCVHNFDKSWTQKSI